MSKRLCYALFAGLLAVLSSPAEVSMAQDAEPIYVQLDCMRSTSSDYAALEGEIWKPMHQAMVNQGKKLRWTLYWVRFGDRSECDYYTVNVVTLSQLNAGVAYREVFREVHPGKDIAEAMAETAAAREMVWTQLWRVVDRVPWGDYKYAQVNRFLADDLGEYVEMEQEIYKPVHEAMVEAGATAGWSLNTLVAPHGSALGYNVATADFLNSLGGINFGAFMTQVHPDADLDELGERTMEARELILSEVWQLLDSTQPAE